MLMRGRVRTCLSLLTASAIAVGALVVAGAAPASAAPATPQFVQVRAKEVTSGTTNSLAFSSGNTVGNLIVVYAIWSNTNSASVSDSGGNAYTAAGPRTTWGTNWSAQVFYAKNIAGGSNTVTVTFATAVNSFGTAYIHEYAGIDKASPLDVSTSAIGTSRAMSSGSVTTTNASDLLFGAGASRNTGHQGRLGVDHPVRRVRQPHRGSQRHHYRLVRCDRDAKQQRRLGYAAGGLQGRPW
jgi:hypothetical protein